MDLGRTRRRGNGDEAGIPGIHRVAGFLLVTSVAMLVFFAHLSDPFDWSIHGTDDAWYANVARNFARHGFLELRLAMSFERGGGAPLAPYLSHPPMLGWLVGIVARAFGSGEWQTRVVPAVLSTLAALAALGALSQAIGMRFAVIGALLAVLSPVWAYYGNMADPQGSGVLLGLFASSLLLARFEALPNRSRLAALSLGLAWTISFDWPGFVLTGLVAFRFWWTQRRAALVLLALLGTSLGLYVLHRLWAEPGTSTPWTLSKLLRHSTRDEWKGSHGQPLPWRTCAAVIASHHRSGAFLATTALGVVALAVERRFFLWIPALVGLVHVLLFPIGAFVHDFWQIYLIAGLALPAASLLQMLGQRSRLVWPASLVLVVASGIQAVQDRERRWSKTAEEAIAIKRAALEAKRATTPEQWIGSTRTKMPPFEYYVDRRCMWGLKEPRALLRTWADIAPYFGGLLLREDERERWQPVLNKAAVHPASGFSGYRLFLRSP